MNGTKMCNFQLKVGLILLGTLVSDDKKCGQNFLDSIHFSFKKFICGCFVITLVSDRPIFMNMPV